MSSPVEDLDQAVALIERAVASGVFGLAQSKGLRGACGAVRQIRRMAHLPDHDNQPRPDGKSRAAGE